MDKSGRGAVRARRIALTTADVWRFWQKVRVGGREGCWPWAAATNDSGYGVFWLRGSVLAHRVAVVNCGREIADGMTVDHTCFQRTCCNPAHLAVVPASVNNGRTRRALSRFCARGHEFTPENTIVKHGHRNCRECTNAVRRKGFVRGAAGKGSYPGPDGRKASPQWKMENGRWKTACPAPRGYAVASRTGGAGRMGGRMGNAGCQAESDELVTTTSYPLSNPNQPRPRRS